MRAHHCEPEAAAEAADSTHRIGGRHFQPGEVLDRVGTGLAGRVDVVVIDG